MADEEREDAAEAEAAPSSDADVEALMAEAAKAKAEAAKAEAAKAEAAKAAELEGFAQAELSDGAAAEGPSDAPDADAPGMAGKLMPAEPEPGAGPSSPYDHMLTIRGDVDPTKALALFLGGVTFFLLAYLLLTYSSIQEFTVTAKVTSGHVAIPNPGAREIISDGPDYTFLEEGEPKAPDEFARVGEQLVFHPEAEGKEVSYRYRVGHAPILSRFMFPSLGDLLNAVIDNATGGSFQITCPNPECPSKLDGGRMVDLDASSGQALEEFRSGEVDDPTPPGIKCPLCSASLDGEVVVALPSYRFRHGLLSSVRRTSLGFLIAAVICLPLGVLAGAFPPIKRFISPIEISGGYTPPVALIPLGIAAFGVLKNAGFGSVFAAETVRIGFLVLFTSLWLYPLTVKEIESVDEVYVNTAYTLGASRSQVILKVLFPVSIANIWQHLRVSFGIGWALILLAEGFMVGREPSETGIGFFMVEMQRRAMMENYFAALIAIVVTGVVFDFLFTAVGKWLFPYQEGN